MTSSPHPIYDEVLAEARSRTGAFARFALEPHEEPAAPGIVTVRAPVLEEPTPPEEIPTEEQPAARRSGTPRSQR